MKDIKKTLKIAQKMLQPKPQKPKLTPEQFKQLAKVNSTLKMVLEGKLTLKDLEKDTNDMLVKLAKTFIEEAAKNRLRRLIPSIFAIRSIRLPTNTVDQLIKQSK